MRIQRRVGDDFTQAACPSCWLMSRRDGTRMRKATDALIGAWS
jgi:hypothetical protein